MFRRRHAFGSGAGYGSGATRLIGMIGLLIVLGMLTFRARDASIWKWFADDRAPAEVASPRQPAPPTPEPQATIVLGPTDEDPEEQEAVREPFEAVTDRAALAIEEMPAYWRLMNWSRRRSFEALDQRARRDILFTQLWERPQTYRGALVHLRMHVRRVLMHDAPENTAGLKSVYELWGWTDESKSFPYVVLVSELPTGLKLGPDVREEVDFDGYFLKLLAYEAFDKPRAAPLLIGRVRRVAGLPPPPEERHADDARWFYAVLGGGALLLLGSQFLRRKRTTAKPSTATTEIDSRLFQQDPKLESVAAGAAPNTWDLIAAQRNGSHDHSSDSHGS